MAQEVEQVLGLAAARAEVDVGDEDRAVAMDGPMRRAAVARIARRCAGRDADIGSQCRNLSRVAGEPLEVPGAA
ncbi:MAG: hypothetical protein MUF32_05150 [Burkholderiaceae bacterium]|nr:hypothetical protein [Burkholderiaceae bacterium]